MFVEFGMTKEQILETRKGLILFLRDKIDVSISSDITDYSYVVEGIRNLLSDIECANNAEIEREENKCDACKKKWKERQEA